MNKIQETILDNVMRLKNEPRRGSNFLSSFMDDDEDEEFMVKREANQRNTHFSHDQQQEEHQYNQAFNKNTNKNRNDNQLVKVRDI